jgi:hypothetical protein
MVRSAIARDRPLSAKQEARLESGRAFKDEYNRRAGHDPKDKTTFGQRWEASKAKVKREDEAIRERQKERIQAIIEEREREVAGAAEE